MKGVLGVTVDPFAWTTFGPIAALSRPELMFAVWCLTAFPACGLEHMCKQLEEVATALLRGESLDSQMDAIEAGR